MTKPSLSLDADSIKRSVVDVWPVLDALGLLDGAHRQARGAFIFCPWHAERTPSCSVRIGDAGLVAHCFGCGQSADLFGFIAAVRGFDVQQDFWLVLKEAAELPGAAEFIPVGFVVPHTVPHAVERRYPPQVAELWARCGSMREDTALSDALRARAIDPAAVADLDLARVLPRVRLPDWCRSWSRSGNRLVLPLFDARGQLASLHGRILAKPLPMGQRKGRFPRGYTARGLVMADATARALLAAGAGPHWTGEAHIVEGATDFLTLATRWGDAAEQTPATLGIFAGAWSAELAARIPRGATVRIFAHGDPAGQRYADEIRATLGRCAVCVVELTGEEGTG